MLPSFHRGSSLLGRRLSSAPRHVPNLALPRRHTSSAPQHSAFIPFFTRAHPPRTPLRLKLLWALPVAGGLALYLTPRGDSLLPALFASPTIIPPKPPKRERQLFIESPDEEGRALPARVIRFFRVVFWEPLLTAGRFIHLCFIFVPVMLSAPMLLIGNPEARFQGDRWGAVWWYGQLVAAMERAGPTFIKLAQWAASRADLFPAILCDRMGAMHSNSKAHSIHHTRRVIERVFQRPFEDVFEEFDDVPIGVGAIAQVYRATLRHDLLPPSYLNPKRPAKSGAAAFKPQIPPDPPPSVPSASVAIKVLHPHVHKVMSCDLSIMATFAAVITLIPGMEWLSLPEEVAVFGHMMGEQLDLRHEADNLSVFERNFGARKTAVSFPRPLTLFSSRDVLVEEYQNAVPLKAFLQNGGGPFDDQIAEMGLDAFLNMLLLDNFVHSDLHPGNIMIKFYKPSTQLLLKNIAASIFHTTPPEELNHATASENDAVVDRLRGVAHDARAWRTELDELARAGYQPEIVFIDTGLVTTLNDLNRRNFLDLFRAIAEFDGYRAGTLMVERCRAPHLAIEAETFALKMQHVVLRVKRKTFSLGQIKISDILTEVLRAVRDHHVKMEGDFINTVISVLLLEGIGRQLDPNLDLFKSALPILRKLGRQMATQEKVDSVANLPRSNLGAYLKVWVWLEARQFATSATVNFDELVRYDWLTPNI